MLDTRRFRDVLKKEKALNPLRLKASEMAPPVGLEPTTHTVRSIVALLGAFAMLVVSSCSEHRFICRRQRGAPSQLTAGAAVCGRVDGLGQQVN